MKLHELKPKAGSTRARKRAGRGIGSGIGKTAGRGSDGQKSRSGAKIGLGFEGGQTRAFKRHRKVGFINPHRTEYAIVNVSRLNIYEDGAVVTAQTLRDDKVIKKASLPLKILGQGELTKKLTVKAQKFTASAEEKIKAAGGTIEVV